MSLVHDEQVKVTANWLNSSATATVTVGVLAPLASTVYGLNPAPSIRALLPALAIWLFAALALAGRVAASRPPAPPAAPFASSAPA